MVNGMVIHSWLKVESMQKKYKRNGIICEKAKVFKGDEELDRRKIDAANRMVFLCDWMWEGGDQRGESEVTMRPITKEKSSYNMSKCEHTLEDWTFGRWRMMKKDDYR